MSIRECVRCQGNKKDGSRCTRNTCMYSDYCWQHTRQVWGVRVADSNIPGSGKGLYAVRGKRAQTEADQKKMNRRFEDQQRRAQQNAANQRLLIFKAGEVVTEYRGDNVSLDWYNQNNSGYGILHGQRVLDAKSTQNGLGRYANDCRSENKRAGDCGGSNAKLTTFFRNGVLMGHVKATKNIYEGDEIFVSYGAAYWR